MLDLLQGKSNPAHLSWFSQAMTIRPVAVVEDLDARHDAKGPPLGRGCSGNMGVSPKCRWAKIAQAMKTTSVAKCITIAKTGARYARTSVGSTLTAVPPEILIIVFLLRPALRGNEPARTTRRQPCKALAWPSCPRALVGARV